MKKHIAVILAVLLMMLTLSACGETVGSGEPESNGTDSSEQVGTVTENDTKDTVPESEGEEDDVITAVIYPDYDKFEGKTDEEIIATVKAEVASVNKKLPTFKQVRNIELRKNEFEKTTTRKIMRYKV